MTAPGSDDAVAAISWRMWPCARASKGECEVCSSVEALPGLVPGSVFKTDDATRERTYGGFDSRTLPLLLDERV
jgi:hypothetical protein